MTGEVVIQLRHLGLCGTCRLPSHATCTGWAEGRHIRCNKPGAYDVVGEGVLCEVHVSRLIGARADMYGGVKVEVVI